MDMNMHVFKDNSEFTAALNALNSFGQPGHEHLRVQKDTDGSNILKTEDKEAVLKGTSKNILVRILSWLGLRYKPDETRCSTVARALTEMMINNKQFVVEALDSGRINRNYFAKFNKVFHDKSQTLDVLFLNHLKEAAAKGDPTAQQSLETLYQHDIGIEPHLEQEFLALKVLADKGDSSALYNLATYHLFGRGTRRDPKLAFQCMEKLAKQGDFKAQLQLGTYYEQGIGTKKDNQKAFEWVEKACAGGNSWALHKLGDFYRDGIGVEQNINEANSYYTMAELNNAGLEFYPKENGMLPQVPQEPENDGPRGERLID